MCGLAGLILGKKRRTKKQMEEIATRFERMLLLSEHRGRYATGVAWIKIDGSFAVAKAPLSARSFVLSSDYRRWQRGVNVRTAILMGHTRYPTQGSHLTNSNNQPLSSSKSRPMVLTHNGNIPDVGCLFNRFKLSRRLEVDSEILLKLAVRHLGPTGIHVQRLATDLGSLPGGIAAVIVAPSNPDETLFIRRGRPLCFALHRQRRLLAYASEISILEDAFCDCSGWDISSLRPSCLLVVDRNDPTSLTPFPLADCPL